MANLLHIAGKFAMQRAKLWRQQLIVGLLRVRYVLHADLTVAVQVNLVGSVHSSIGAVVDVRWNRT